MTLRNIKIRSRVKLLGGPECYSTGTVVDFGDKGATVNIERNPGVPEHDCRITVPWSQLKLVR